MNRLTGLLGPYVTDAVVLVGWVAIALGLGMYSAPLTLIVLGFGCLFVVRYGTSD